MLQCLIVWVSLASLVGCGSSNPDFDDGGVPVPVSITGGTGISASGTTVSLQIPVSIANGGTGATTSNGAVDNLLTTQAGHANHVLTTNATSPSWADVRAVLATGDDAGFVVKGTYTGAASTPPAIGASTRLMWYPQRAAFRAGSVTASQWDDANIGNYSIAFGNDTQASGFQSTAMGASTTASNLGSTAMGRNTTASGDTSTAIGGSTTASGDYSTAFGDGTTASGGVSTAMGFSTTASAIGATAMGYATTASGYQSTAMGSYVSTNAHAGSFMYGDSSTPAVLTSVVDDEFAVRANGGYRLFSNSALTAGVTLAAGAGAWATISDRNAKQDFHDVDGDSVLGKIANMRIQGWRYKAEVSRAVHIGPVAQDFFAAFGLGDSDRTITTVDIDGVNLLAIQALVRRSAVAERKSAELERDNAELRNRLTSLELAVHRLEHVDAVAAKR